MKLILLLITMLFTYTTLHADDICYENPYIKSTGFIGLLFPQRVTPIKLVDTSSSLSEVNINFAIDGFNGTFTEHLGINDQERSKDLESGTKLNGSPNDKICSNYIPVTNICSNWDTDASSTFAVNSSSLFDIDFGIVGINFFNTGNQYYLGDLNSANSSQEVWNKEFFVSSFFDQFFSKTRLYATYKKDGKDYNVILNPCQNTADYSVPDLSIDDVDIENPPASDIVVDFTVNVSGVLGGSAASGLGNKSYVHYETVDGSLTAGTDYTSTSGTLEIPKDAVSATIPVTILANARSGKFKVMLTNALGARLVDGTGEAVIGMTEPELEQCGLFPSALSSYQTIDFSAGGGGAGSATTVINVDTIVATNTNPATLDYGDVSCDNTACIVEQPVVLDYTIPEYNSSESSVVPVTSDRTFTDSNIGAIKTKKHNITVTFDPSDNYSSGRKFMSISSLESDNKSGITYHFKEGDYYIGSWDHQGNDLTIETDGAVRIFLANGLNFSNNEITINEDGPASDLYIFSEDDIHFSTSGGSNYDITAYFYTKGDFKVDASSASGDGFTGGVTAEGDIFLKNNASFTYEDDGLSDDGFGACSDPYLLAKYTFDECSWSDNQNVLNLSTEIATPSNFDAIAHNTVTEYIPSAMCRAARFSKLKDNYINGGNNLNPTNEGFSLAFWIKWDGSSGENYIVTKNHLYDIKINSSSQLQYRFNDESTWTTLIPVAANKLYHFAFVVSGKTVRVYVDGETVAETTTTAKPIPNNNVTFIGKNPSDLRFGGLIDEFHFYDDAITTSTVLSLYNDHRACLCCPAEIKIVGDYISVSDTYNASLPAFDNKKYINDFVFAEPPLVFVLPSNNGGHSAYIRASSVTRTDFDLANIEPQGEDGPHIAMDLNYIAVNRGDHTLGENSLETCTVLTKKVQWHNNKCSADKADDPNCWQHVNPNNFGWQEIPLQHTYTNPVVFATIISKNNEDRLDGNGYGRELSRPWMTVAIKHEDGKVYVALDRGETTYGLIDQPEEIAYMVTEGDVQSYFLDDADKNISYETIYKKAGVDGFAGFGGTSYASNSDQKFTFVNTYLQKPLVMANLNSRNDADGGWFRRNAITKTEMSASVWEDRRGSFANEGSYVGAAPTTAPIGVSPNQDTERTHAKSEDGALIAFDSTFSYSSEFTLQTGAFDAVEEGANAGTVLHTKVVNQDFNLTLWHLDAAKIPEIANMPTMTRVIGSADIDNLLTSTNAEYRGTKHYTAFNLSSTNFLQEYSVPKALRQAQIEITYPTNADGTAVDWTGCYANAANCDSTQYGSACVTACTQTAGSADPDAAMSDACMSCYFDNRSSALILKNLSTDRFAVRPKRFNLAFNALPAELLAGEDYNMTVTAEDANGVATIDYNATRTPIGTSGNGFDFNISNTQAVATCTPGDVNTTKSDFSNGDFTTNFSYSEVGTDLNMTVSEINEHEFALIDGNSPEPPFVTPKSVRFIEDSNVSVTFLTHHFDVTINLDNANGNPYTYYSGDINGTSAVLDYTMTSLNKQGVVTQNFSSECYADNLSNNFAYTYLTTDANSLKFRDTNDTNTTAQNGPVFSDLNTTQRHTLAESKDNFTAGASAESILINFDRVADTPKSPMSIAINDINVSGLIDYNQTVSANTNNNVLFFYGRTHTGRTTIAGNNGDAKVYTEIFCQGAQCTPAAFNGALGPVSVDDVNWYINLNDSFLNDGNVSSTNQRNGDTIVQDNGASNYDTTNAGFTLVNYTYDESKGYPFKTTMEVQSAPWLIYNKYNPAATSNTFEIEFHQNGSEWAGKSNTNNSTDSNASAAPLRRIMW